MYVVDLKNVSKIYRVEDREVSPLKNVSLKVSEGSWLRI